MENIEVNPQTPGEYLIRVGDALAPKAPLNIKIEGILSAPADFLAGKKEEYKPELAHLLIDRDNQTLKLVLDEYDPYSRDEITGSLKDNVELEKWNINTAKRWTVGEFLQFVRERKMWFAKPEDQVALLKGLQTWKVNVDREIKIFNDNKGNSTDSVETVVSKVQGLVYKFNLSIPVFKGYDKKKFTVEIGLDPKATTVDIYLYSDELYQLRIDERDRLFAFELKKFDSLDFNCSQVYIS
jgi:hypothetical protein